MAPAPAQETIHYASIAGRVTDPSGGVVPGAVVTARQLETNWKNQAVTDREGRFRFPYLNVGPYEIKVQKPGFSDAVRRVSLAVGSTFDLPVALSVAAADSEVMVTADAAVLETGRSQTSAAVSRSEVASLPLNGRNYVDLALLAPGVSPTNTGSTQLFAETSAVPGQGVSIGSQRNFSNSFIVDGLSANDDAAGLSGAFYSLDVVREFQVVTSGGQAEFGRALGGYISMVTRSGTNALHGDLYGYFRSQRWNAANPLSHTTLPLTQLQSGASLGGPVAQDRTFYFVNFEQRILNQGGLVTIAPASVAAINNRLALANYPGATIATGVYPDPVHSNNFLAKADHRFSPRDQFNIRYSLYSVDGANTRGAGGLSAVTAAAGLTDLDQTVAIGNVAALSPRTVNETRAQFTPSRLNANPNDQAGPAVSIAGTAVFGRLSSSPTARLNNLYEAADNVSHQAGAHALRAGVDVLYNDLTIAFPQSVRGGYSFSSLSNFLNGVYNSSGFTQSFGNPVVAQGNANYGAYVQDEWQAKPRLTLNLGLRYDLQLLRTIRPDTNHVSPRFGFAWAPFQARRTVVRGSFGLFYDRIPLRALANALLSSGNTTEVTPDTFVTVNLSPKQAGAPVFPDILAGLPAGVLVNFTTMNPHIRNAYSQQGAFEIEQQVGANASLSVGYQHVRGLHLVASVNQNTPTCAATGTNNGCRPNPNYGNNRQYSSVGDSHYDGLHVSFVQRPVKWGSFRVSYTWSKALDNVGEFFFSSPIDNFNIWRDYGRSDDDQRHRVAFDGVARLPYGFQLSGSLQYYSALPFNITTGANTVQGTAARPVLPDGSFIGRNTGRGFDLFTVNARLSRTFRIGDRLKIETIAEAFNALNHRNDLIPNGAFGPGAWPANPLPSFGAPTAAGDPRTLQLAARIGF